MTCCTEGDPCPNRPVPNTQQRDQVFGAGFQSRLWRSLPNRHPGLHPTSSLLLLVDPLGDICALQATTFSSESYFNGRRVYGYAQPITEHVTVRGDLRLTRYVSFLPCNPIHDLVSYYFPEGMGGFHNGVSRSSSCHETSADIPNSNTIL